MKPTEEDAFESRYGYKPTQIRTAVDALAVFVNKDNPIKSLALEQVDAIFSKARRRGMRKQIATWGDAGLTGEWADKPISLYGRNSASGTYGFFKEHVLKTGDYRDEVKEQPGSASVVLGVATDRFAVGYSGIGYATSSVRAVPLSEKEGAPVMAANAENAYSGESRSSSPPEGWSSSRAAARRRAPTNGSPGAHSGGAVLEVDFRLEGVPLVRLDGECRGLVEPLVV